MSVKVSREDEIRADVKRLHAMGYAQELYRAMGGFSNFAISFTIISILSGTLTLFTTAYNQTGPIAGSIGWPLVSVFVVIVGLAMAELASAYPTAGGLYYWSSKLGGPGWGWFTGWFNLIGQFGITAGIDYGLATFAVVWINIKVPGILPDARTILIAYAIALVLHALMNIFGVRLVALLNDVSVWWHIVGVLAIFIALFSAALLFPTPASSGGISNSPFYFGYTQTGYPFWYAFLIGLLLAQYTFTGYDASAHMTEETIGAETKAPWGIVMSIVVSAIAGYILVMGLLIGVRDVAATAAGGPSVNSVLFILSDRLGDNWAFVLLGLIVVAQFFCGMSSVTSNSRMIYAFSRDHAMPLSDVWHTLSKARRVPVNAIWLAAAAAFILAVPSLWNIVAYFAVTSIATIGLYVAYAIPVYLRRTRPQNFRQGVWHLGRWSNAIGWIAIVWVVFISILFMLPANSHETSPTDFGDFLNNFNYTPFVFIVVFLLLTVWYLTSVRHWFKGPVRQGDEQQLEAIEAEYGETHGIGGGEMVEVGAGVLAGGALLAAGLGRAHEAPMSSAQAAPEMPAMSSSPVATMEAPVSSEEAPAMSGSEVATMEPPVSSEEAALSSATVATEEAPMSSAEVVPEEAPTSSAPADMEEAALSDEAPTLISAPVAPEASAMDSSDAAAEDAAMSSMPADIEEAAMSGMETPAEEASTSSMPAAIEEPAMSSMETPSEEAASEEPAMSSSEDAWYTSEEPATSSMPVDEEASAMDSSEAATEEPAMSSMEAPAEEVSTSGMETPMSSEEAAPEEPAMGSSEYASYAAEEPAESSMPVNEEAPSMNGNEAAMSSSEFATEVPAMSNEEASGEATPTSHSEFIPEEPSPSNAEYAAEEPAMSGMDAAMDDSEVASASSQEAGMSYSEADSQEPAMSSTSFASEEFDTSQSEYADEEPSLNGVESPMSGSEAAPEEAAMSSDEVARQEFATSQSERAWVESPTSSEEASMSSASFASEEYATSQTERAWVETPAGNEEIASEEPAMSSEEAVSEEPAMSSEEAATEERMEPVETPAQDYGMAEQEPAQPTRYISEFERDFWR